MITRNRIQKKPLNKSSNIYIHIWGTSMAQSTYPHLEFWRIPSNSIWPICHRNMYPWCISICLHQIQRLQPPCCWQQLINCINSNNNSSLHINTHNIHSSISNISCNSNRLKLNLKSIWCPVIRMTVTPRGQQMALHMPRLQQRRQLMLLQQPLLPMRPPPAIPWDHHKITDLRL